jgi:DNA-binding transcriptional ArsR family regulator
MDDIAPRAGRGRLAGWTDCIRRDYPIESLGGSDSLRSRLAEPFKMNRLSQHLKVLQGVGLVTRRVNGTKRPCRLAKAGVEAMDLWLAMLKGIGEEVAARGPLRADRR